MEPSWNTISLDPYVGQLSDTVDPTSILGRVTAQDGPLFHVVTERGAGYRRPSGRLAHLVDLGTAPPIAVGDYVAVDPTNEGPVRSILPRRTVFERKEAGVRAQAQTICANLDLALIVTTAPSSAAREETDRSSLHDYSVRRIERFIATLDPNVQAIAVINKCDLIDEPQRVRRAIEAELPGLRVCLISALTGDGMDGLRTMLEAGTTAVLVGSSGSGKSTLVSRLAGSDVRTGAIRAADGRGRHTTTGRRMYELGGGALIVDTPGVREVQLWSEDADEQLGSAFPEIDRLATECRFSDCRHQGEPGCAVQAAVRDGRVTHDRYLSYLELQEEQSVAAARREKRDRLNDRRQARKSRMKRRSRGS